MVRPDTARPIVSKEELAEHIERLAREVGDAYARDNIGSGEELVVVPVLTGAMLFACEFIKHFEKSPIAIHPVMANSYGDDRQSHSLSILNLNESAFRDRHVLILDDVLDSGKTLETLVKLIRAFSPRSLKIAVMLRKIGAQRYDVRPDFIGTDVPDIWLIGFGLDDHGRWRHLPFVTTIIEEKDATGQSSG